MSAVKSFSAAVKEYPFHHSQYGCTGEYGNILNIAFPLFVSNCGAAAGAISRYFLSAALPCFALLALEDLTTLDWRRHPMVLFPAGCINIQGSRQLFNMLLYSSSLPACWLRSLCSARHHPTVILPYCPVSTRIWIRYRAE